MADLVFSVLCSKHLIDPETNVLSLFEVAEKITLQPFEGETVEKALEEAKRKGSKGLRFPAQMRLVSWWVRSDFSQPESAQMRVSFLGPLGEKLLEQIVSIELVEHTGQRIILRLERLQIGMLGRHWFVIARPRERKGKTANWITVARFPLEVVAGEPIAP